MRIIRVLIFFLIGSAAIYVGYLAWTKQLSANSLTPSLILDQIERIKLPSTSNLPQVDIDTDQLGEVSDRFQAAQQTAQQVLGETISVNESATDSSLTQKVIDRGLYLYCQDVVAKYEQAVTNN